MDLNKIAKEYPFPEFHKEIMVSPLHEKRLYNLYGKKLLRENHFNVNVSFLEFDSNVYYLEISKTLEFKFD